ncbi:MAG: thioesterase [Flavobacteriaceae bacterium]|nr:thioesterase [Flavobacteriaceae bacterium]|tara:strand:- start:343703 stop:344089 length:387 start_codon:yes stop_codon:yes gene_type:complete
MYSIEIEVMEEHLDALNHVNNAVYVKWMEDVAGSHWKHLTRNYDLDHYIWVVLRHEIDYKAQATLGDVIIGKTRVGDSKGFTSERFIEFYKNDQLLVKAKTTWAMLHRSTYKPARIREDVLQVLNPDN